MNRSELFGNTSILYTLFLSGILFYGVPTDGQTYFSRLIGMTIGFFALYALCRFVPLGPIQNKSVSPILNFIALILCLAFACATLYSLASEMPHISDTLSGGRFSHFFWILSILLCLYVTRDGMLTLSRLCLPLLPLLLFPLALTWFSLLGYEGAFPSIPPEKSVVFRTSYICDVAVMLGTVPLYLAYVRDEKSSPESRCEKAALTAAFVLFLFTFFAENIKYVLCFGTNGAAAIDRPDRILLTLIPYINVQDIFLFVYYFSFVLRLCVATASVRKYAAALFESRNKNEKAYKIPIFTGVLIYVGFLLFCRFPSLYRVALWTPIALFAAKSLYFSASSVKKTKDAA